MKIHRPEEELPEGELLKFEATFPGAPKQADCAEELSEIENVVQRACFLTQSDSTKRAA